MRDPSEKVVVGYLHPGLVRAAFMECVVDLLVYDTAFHRRIVSGGGRLATQAGANLSGPRNGLIRRFLEYGKADWLWMVDTDMTFQPDTIERLLEHADPEKAPIVGGLCFGWDDKGDIQPTLFGLVGDERHPQVIRYHEWPPDAMFQVAATGAACMLLHKSALEKIRDIQMPGRPGKRGFNDAFPWFQELEHDGQPVSEDIGFCWRAGLCQIPVYVNTAVQLGHIKDQELTMDAYFAQRGGFRDEQGEGDVQRLRRREGDTGGAAPGPGAGLQRPAGQGAPGSVHGAGRRAGRRAGKGVAGVPEGAEGHLSPPPATEPVAIVVPVLGRPHQATRFMDSLRAATDMDLATVYAVVGPEGTAEATQASETAWHRAGAEVLMGGAISFAEKCNLAYAKTIEPWLFLVGSDVRFHPGWLDHAQAVAGDRYHVVGTNDLGNPRVMAGEHATHLLIRRSYVDEHGASWDGPGGVAHESYAHWFVDDEIVTVAKQRGVWAMALGSVVEHLHPAWNKAPMDAVYELGASRAAADRRRFEERLAEHAR